MTQFRRLMIFIVAGLHSYGASAFAEPISPTKVDVRTIWDRAPHNAFTDLIRWKGRFVCAFREGRRHVSTDGKIRVLSSENGDDWQSAALISLEGYDLRDAGLSIAPDGRLMLVGGAAPRKNDNEKSPTGTFVAFTDDGREWTQPHIVVDPGRWLWRVTWYKDRAYGVAYAASEGFPATSLLVSNDGNQFRTLLPKMFDEGYPTEAVLRFDDNGTAYCLQRRDGESPQNSAYLGISEPPYTEWSWHDLGFYFGGPNLIQLPGGRWIAAGRIFRNEEGNGNRSPITTLAELDVENKTLRPILPLPSGGDTSYPGLVWHDGLLCVSYYSSHEGKASIYLAKVKLE